MQPDERPSAPYYEASQAVARGWERRREFLEDACAPVREWLVRELAPRPGDRILELAAGVGDTGFDAAALVGEHGRLLSTDLTPAMSEVARRRAAERGVGNADFRVMNAERIDLADGSVDGVLCRFGYMLTADPAAALAQTRRVLRPGGRLALAVWSSPERNPWLAVGSRLMVTRGLLPASDPQAPGPFAMADEPRTAAMLADAGFERVRAEEVHVSWRYDDAEHYLDIAQDTSFSAAQALAALPAAERRALAEALSEAFAPYATDGGGYALPGVCLAVVAS
jgi:ubiquinone/menaquinone biosynthesis C-methylase UbiE